MRLRVTASVLERPVSNAASSVGSADLGGVVSSTNVNAVSGPGLPLLVSPRTQTVTGPSVRPVGKKHVGRINLVIGRLAVNPILKSRRHGSGQMRRCASDVTRSPPSPPVSETKPTFAAPCAPVAGNAITMSVCDAPLMVAESRLDRRCNTHWRIRGIATRGKHQLGRIKRASVANNHGPRGDAPLVYELFVPDNDVVTDVGREVDTPEIRLDRCSMVHIQADSRCGIDNSVADDRSPRTGLCDHPHSTGRSLG